MKKVGILGLVAVLTIVVSGCAMPTGAVTRGEDRPAIAIIGAPETAVLVVDGVSHGDAAEYDGDPKTLLVEPGTHSVRVEDGGKVLLTREVYIRDGETRVLTITR